MLQWTGTSRQPTSLANTGQTLYQSLANMVILPSTMLPHQHKPTHQTISAQSPLGQWLPTHQHRQTRLHYVNPVKYTTHVVDNSTMYHVLYKPPALNCTCAKPEPHCTYHNALTQSKSNNITKTALKSTNPTRPTVKPPLPTLRPTSPYYHYTCSNYSQPIPSTTDLPKTQYIS